MKIFKQYAVFHALAASLFLISGLAACSTFDDPELEIPPVELDSDEIAINFSVDNMLMGSMTASTRADGDEVDEADAEGHLPHSAEAHERQVNHVYFLFFKDSKFVSYQRSDVKPGDTKVTFPVPSSLEPTTDDSNPKEYDVIMVANADYYPPTGYATFPSFLNANTKGKTITQVQEVLAISVDHTMNKVTDQYLPMQGKLKDGNGNDLKFSFKIVDGRYVSNGAILFKRQVARVDLNNYATSDLDIKWVKVCNYRNFTYIWRDEYTKGTTEPGIVDEKPEDQLPAYTAVEPAEYDESGISSQKVRASLYTFPNSVEKPSQDDAVTTYLMIAGYYKGSENLNYYRFNLNQGSQAQYLEKNHIYTANIMGVKGPGAPTEAQARLTNAPVLVATVEDTWDDDDVNSDADASGNFLILSKTSLTFDGEKDLKQNITVRVREGMTWTVEEINTTGNSNGDFGRTINHNDDGNGSITFTTLTHNNTNFVKYGYFKVTGATKDGKILTVNINIQQLSVNDDIKMLTVNGQTGTIIPKISGTGATLLYQVQTGSMTQGWKVVPVDANGKESSSAFNPWSSAGASYTPAGGNKGFLELVIPANITGNSREVMLKVTRNGVTEEEVAPVYIKISQPKSKVLLSVYPYPQNGLLEIEGFLDEIKQVNLNHSEERTNSFSVQKDVFVTLADPINYEYRVETNFDGCRDLTISPNSALLRSVKMSHPNLGLADNKAIEGTPEVPIEGNQLYTRYLHYQKIDRMKNGQKFYMNVFRTGPGDPDIMGTIKITAYPISGSGETQTISFDVRITTSCEIADVVLYYDDNKTPVLVADRNVGAVPRLDGTTYNRALNFSGINYMHITNTSASTDFDNKLYSGGYYAWDDINRENGTGTYGDFKYWAKDNFFKFNRDPGQLTSPFYTDAYSERWIVPEIACLNQVWRHLQWSKQRPYLVSKLKHNGNYMGCYIPCAGATNNNKRNTDGYGYYHSSNINANTSSNKTNWGRSVNGINGYYQAGTQSNIKQENAAWNTQHNFTRNASTLYSVRCVMKITAAEVTTYENWLQSH